MCGCVHMCAHASWGEGHRVHVKSAVVCECVENHRSLERRSWKANNNPHNNSKGSDGSCHRSELFHTLRVYSLQPHCEWRPHIKGKEAEA